VTVQSESPDHLGRTCHRRPQYRAGQQPDPIRHLRRSARFGKLIFDTSGHDIYYDNDGGASPSGGILLAHLDQAGMMEATSIKLMTGERGARSHCSIANAFTIAGTTREAGPCRPLPIPA
jgi:hypothetical protein